MGSAKVCSPVQEQGAGPGEQVDADKREFEPGGVDGEQAGWEPTEPGVLPRPNPVLDPGVAAMGAIEGACRYLVKDRMAITGARRSLPGAEALLLLGAVITSGDFEAYWKSHVRQEHERTHASRYQHQYDLAA